MRWIAAWFGLVLGSVAASVAGGEVRAVSVASGTVRDAGGSPLAGVAIHVKGANLSDVATNPEGWFRFAVVDMPEEIPLRFSRAGFEDAVLALRAAEAEIELDVVLQKKVVALTMTEFKPGRTIQGAVSGLAPGEEDEYKVVVYVLTNKWYIHPQAVATPGQGFALLEPGGSWKIGTVWRGHQAIRLAMALVPKDAWAPPTIEPGEMQPEDALRTRLAPRVLSVVEAPAGI